MIVPMKKVAVIVLSKEADSAVKRLRSLGVLHVEHQQAPKGKDIAALHDDIELANSSVLILSSQETKKGMPRSPAKEASDWKLTARHIIDLQKRMEQLDEYSATLRHRIEQWDEWGDFDPELIKSLAVKNIHIRLYQIPISEINNLPSGVIVKKLFIAGGLAGCVIISRGEADVPFKEIPLPKTGLREMKARLAEDLKVMHNISEEIKKSVSYQGALIRAKKGLEKELEFNEALKGMGQAGQIAYIVGYAPADETDKVIQAAKQNRWGIFVRDPSEEDAVPTLIRNPRWASLMEPVFRLMEIVPGYRELDISPLFLLFLSLFFGMIIGDAGYGFLYIALTAIAHKRLGNRLKDAKIFFLLYLFSSSAVLWGVLTGTVFGQEWYINAGMRPLLPVLNNTRFLQAFCFFLGAFHLTLGQGWQAIRKFPSLAALSDIGWISILWAAFFVARMLILSYPLPPAAKWLIIGGVILVIFFTNPSKNILKTIGTGLGAFALSIMNNFTDVVSYVRLFAVGLAGVAISDTVNTLAASMGGNSLPTQLVILFLGHTINVVLGPISVLVHGVRLNVLEFSGHAGLSWSGRAYKPLKDT
ncbi:MAG: hypothetical protein Q8Q87_04855 [Candidatus Omnitrophota bacterium]|nr:hypothetical protein [Candidatus Omnitrophota bacterium]